MLERFQNVVFDTNYVMLIPGWGFVVAPKIEDKPKEDTKKKEWPMWWMDKILQKIGLAPEPKTKKDWEKN